MSGWWELLSPIVVTTTWWASIPVKKALCYLVYEYNLLQSIHMPCSKPWAHMQYAMLSHCCYLDEHMHWGSHVSLLPILTLTLTQNSSFLLHCKHKLQAPHQAQTQLAKNPFKKSYNVLLPTYQNTMKSKKSGISHQIFKKSLIFNTYQKMTKNNKFFMPIIFYQQLWNKVVNWHNDDFCKNCFVMQLF